MGAFINDIKQRFGSKAPAFIREPIKAMMPGERQFRRHLRNLEESQWWSAEKLAEYQNELLRPLIRHAYENVPYYRNVFDELGAHPEDIRRCEDLKLLPVLTKDIVRNEYSNLQARNIKRFNPSLSHTSGSTGEPLYYYIDWNLRALIRAATWRHWRWCGIDFNDRIAVFRGSLVNDFGTKEQCYYRESGNEVQFSTFEMNERSVNEYVDVLNRFRPALIRGYPASLEILARYIRTANLAIIPPKAIHTSSETVLPEQRAIIGEVFRAPLFDAYGHGESTVWAGECEQHTGLHLFPEFGYTEFLPNAEASVNGEEIFDVISTSLWNYSMPLLRYDTEDMAELKDPLCPCGRGLPLIKGIIGRQADIIEGLNGVRVSPSSFVHYWKYKVADGLIDIRYAQIVQENKALLRVRLTGKCSSENERLITGKIKQLLGDMKVEFDYLPVIPTGEKWRFTVSRISKNR